jgi:hypothetical protein
MTSLDHFFGVINFLVIEEPHPEFVIEARTTDIGPSSGMIKQKGKKHLCHDGISSSVGTL